MPEIRCVNCGQDMKIDTYSTPYEGEIACVSCQTVMDVYVGNSSKNPGVKITRKYPTYWEIKPIWNHLSKIEQDSIWEASRSIGSGAYTASELMALRTIESILRRIYDSQETLGKLIKKMEGDERLRDYRGIITYFKDVRNRIAHPEKLSTQLDAESTFKMTKRLLIEIIQRIV